MKTLEQLLSDFDGRKAKSVSDLTTAFEDIAKRVLYGGFFEINDKTRIFPLEIEFYYYNENKQYPEDLNDNGMYHHNNKGKDDVPYFPIFTLYPHKSGVDVTFENKKREFRASFLIRTYHYEYESPETSDDAEKPSYLWEDMFGLHSLSGNGFSIKWHDDDSFEVLDPKKSPRIHFNKYVDGKKVADKKPWRFSR